METRKQFSNSFLSYDKAPGADAISTEVYKAGGLAMAEKMTELFHCMWRKEAPIIHLYKRKGNPQVCDNHKGMPLFAIAGKIPAKILFKRLNIHLDQTGLITESQFGFRKDSGTLDMMIDREATSGEMPRTECRPIHDVDFTTAFDTVSRDGVWEIMAKFSCPPRFIAMVRQFHDDMQARVQNE